MTVIGCVWGAHRAVLEMFDDGAGPTYAWCEREWTTRLRKTAPGPGALPNWLQWELWAAWRRHLAQRRTEPVQLELWGAA